ncbi:MAG TPA: hypothetical protein IAB35_04275 [Candidatus Faecimonas gallistercoris]|nr:hypothetical protein [Candidatus Faecimonas gallistercoris]
MKKGKFKYIVIIVLLVIYCAGMYLVFGVDEAKERKASTTLLVGDSAVWNYSSREWMNISSQEMLSSFDWQEFHTYVDNQYFGDYYVWLDEQWYLFDSNRDAVSYQGNLFAYKADFEMDILRFNTVDITDFTYVQEVLKNYGLDPNSPHTLATVSSFDFDKDGVLENFYVISNVFATDFFPDKYFSFVFMVDNNNINVLYEDMDVNDGTNGCKPNIYTVADVDNDNNYEIILMCSRYSNQTPITMLYEYQDDSFKIEISNQ